MYDPDLHLFIGDDEILARESLHRMVQTLRRESCAPVLGPSGEDEGSVIGYATAAWDQEAGVFRLWYSCNGLRVAESSDLLDWRRLGLAYDPKWQYSVDNASVAPVGPDVFPWFAGAKLVGVCKFNESLDEDNDPGLYAFRSMDGVHIDVRRPGILPRKGDRSSLYLDEVSGEYMFITRPYHGFMPGFRPKMSEEVVRHRLARMWKSRDMVDWEDQRIVLRADDSDPLGTQVYGMQPFRYGKGFLAFVETYHESVERLDTRLSHSDDGLHWHWVGRREAILPCGGEGSWDSHWVVPTLNPPFGDEERILVPYIGASTKHASGLRRRRAIGLATIRKDGWVSLEAGRVEGTLVTRELPLDKPMKLELNVDVYAGYIAVDVISAFPGREFDPLEGYGADASRVEQVDCIRRQIMWGDRKVVEPIGGDKCFLRFTMKQGSLFSYRWSAADSA